MENKMLELLKTRRSVRAYKPEQITAEELDAVVEAGTWAPTGQGKQSPVIVAVQSPKCRQAVMERYIQYLGLDVLGDWVYNGNRYQSTEAQLFVNALLEEDSGGFSIGVEL